MESIALGCYLVLATAILALLGFLVYVLTNDGYIILKSEDTEIDMGGRMSSKRDSEPS